MTGKHEKPPAVLVDGEALASIPVTDRGFLFGDGIFESIAVRSGVVTLWPWHLRRLTLSAQRLHITLPDPALLLEEVLAVGGQNSAVRLVVTRGDAVAPGYAPSAAAQTRRVVMQMDLPKARAPLQVGVCAGTLSPGANTGEMKHLSRLPQVLLAGERALHNWDEALVTDGEGQIVEATQGNVLVHWQGEWLTPPVGAGVAGVYRQYLLDGELIRQQPVALAQLSEARCVAVCNALRGIEAVSAIADIAQYDTEPALALRRAAA